MGGTRQNKAKQRRNKAEQNQTWQNRRNKAKQRRNCSALFVPKARILRSRREMEDDMKERGERRVKSRAWQSSKKQSIG
eukprot:scaffold91636_cov36-Cyclotella_meneghiniana.AAC.5